MSYYSALALMFGIVAFFMVPFAFAVGMRDAKRALHGLQAIALLLGAIATCSAAVIWLLVWGLGHFNLLAATVVGTVALLAVTYEFNTRVAQRTGVRKDN